MTTKDTRTRLSQESHERASAVSEELGVSVREAVDLLIQQADGLESLDSFQVAPPSETPAPPTCWRQDCDQSATTPDGLCLECETYIESRCGMSMCDAERLSETVTLCAQCLARVSAEEEARQREEEFEEARQREESDASFAEQLARYVVEKADRIAREEAKAQREAERQREAELEVERDALQRRLNIAKLEAETAKLRAELDQHEPMPDGLPW